jgi:hypothetical protein
MPKFKRQHNIYRVLKLQGRLARSLHRAQGAILRVLVTPRSGLDDVAWFSGAEGGWRVDSNNSSECVW